MRSASSQSAKSRSRAIKPCSIQKTWPRRESSSMATGAGAQPNLAEESDYVAGVNDLERRVVDEFPGLAQLSRPFATGPHGPDRRWASPR